MDDLFAIYFPTLTFVYIGHDKGLCNEQFYCRICGLFLPSIEVFFVSSRSFLRIKKVKSLVASAFRLLQSYQILSLIGCILGMIITVVLAGVTSVIISTTDVFYNASSSNVTKRVEHEEAKKIMSMFESGLIVAFFMYIGIFVVTFVTRFKTRLVGVVLIVVGALAISATFLWGIIPFGLLLPAGILALRQKQPQSPSDYSWGRK